MVTKQKKSTNRGAVKPLQRGGETTTHVHGDVDGGGGASSSSGAPSGSVAAVTRKNSTNRKPAERPEGSFGVGDPVQRKAVAIL